MAVSWIAGLLCFCIRYRTITTIAQELEQKGIQKGILLGRQEGRNEGKPEVVRTMLQNGIDRNTFMKMTGLSEDDLAQICH